MKVSARFVTSAADPSGFPPPNLPEIAVVGRSNVGKSTLLNALVGNAHLARTSRTPGRTRLLNWFAVDEKFHLVDLPGYGYAEVTKDMKESWRPLIETYLGKREVLSGVLLLIDIRRGVQAEELDFIPWLKERAIPVVVAMTKSDKLPKHKRTLEVMAAKKALGVKRDPIAVSAQDGDGVAQVWQAVAKILEPAKP